MTKIAIIILDIIIGVINILMGIRILFINGMIIRLKEMVLVGTQILVKIEISDKKIEIILGIIMNPSLVIIII